MSQRFWQQVDKNPHEDNCWIWTGRTKARGPKTSISYGLLGNNRKAHVFAWEESTGRTVPNGMMVDHLCYNSLCVNPSHLRLATAQENANNRYPLAAIGVHRVGHRYLASITHNGVTYELGIFDRDIDAVNASMRKRVSLARAVTHK